MVLLTAAVARAASITVTTTADSVANDGAVSLREALLSINAGADADTDVGATRSGAYGTDDGIRFSIGSGAKTIAPGSPLPWIARSVLIDGTTQAGYTDTPLITIDGTGAGAHADGLGISPTSAATVKSIIVQNFARDGVSIDDSLFADGFNDAAVPPAIKPDVPPPVTETPATLDHLVSRGNGRSGLHVFAGVYATYVEAAGNGADGVLVDSGELVVLGAANVHDNAQAGVRVLRASDTIGYFGQGFIIGSYLVAIPEPGNFHDNVGDGVVFGDPVLQTGVVRASVLNAIVSGNETGIWIRGRNFDSASTYAAVKTTQIYQNRSSGLHVQQSHMLHQGSQLWFLAKYEANAIHNNARMPSADCSGAQTAPQVWFDGQASFPCSSNCTYRLNDTGVPTDPVCAAQDNQFACDQQVTHGSSVDGFEHACVWNASSGYCDLGYRFGNSCGGAIDNQLWGYEGTGSNLPNSVGLYVSGGAAVEVTGNSWLEGGVLFKDATTSGDSDDAIEHLISCSTPVSTCP